MNPDYFMSIFGYHRINEEEPMTTQIPKELSDAFLVIKEYFNSDLGTTINIGDDGICVEMYDYKYYAHQIVPNQRTVTTREFIFDYTEDGTMKVEEV